MRVFIIAELVAIFALIWLILNVIQYGFFKELRGGFFFLSDKWIEEDEKRAIQRNKEIEENYLKNKKKKGKK